MGSCCTTNQDGPELVDKPTSNGVDPDFLKGMTDAQKWAIIKIQARFRGMLARKKVKQVYGFVCSRNKPSNTFTGTKEELQAARQLV